jgi:hypothetical protein
VNVRRPTTSPRSRGTRILGVPRRSYTMEDEPHGLSMDNITVRMATSAFGFSYGYYEEIDSTNVEAKSRASRARSTGWSSGSG